MTDTILANATLVLPDQVIRGALHLVAGRIASIDPGTGVPKGAVDCHGDLVMPGLIELHTDNLERHIEPRPTVHFPHAGAILAHDGELAACGITTVFDALRVGSVVSNGKTKYGEYARTVADEIIAMRAEGALRINHLLHLRAEVCSETLTEEMAKFGPQDGIGIVSLMDHTPGQRQFANLSKFSQYVMGKHAMDQAAFEAHCIYLEGLYARLGPDHQAATVAAAARYGATLASHDDTTVEHVSTSQAQGVRMAEFPTTDVAARACRTSGIAVIMGAPNLIRGGSHSGNVAAADLADAGLLDILSSDYVPAALLFGAVQLGQRWGDMARGLATVTQAPARSVGLTDRGRIAIGQRADLLRFGLAGGVPVTRGLWVKGARVA